MSIEKINAAINLIDENGLERPYLQSKYAASFDEVDYVEKELGFKFTESYCYFLTNYGTGDFRGLEFYGLIHKQVDIEEIPNAFWFTKSSRESDGLKENLFVIEDLGDGMMACIDFSKRVNDEHSIVEFDIGSPDTQSVLADSFGDYFYQRIESVI